MGVKGHNPSAQGYPGLKDTDTNGQNQKELGGAVWEGAAGCSATKRREACCLTGWPGDASWLQQLLQGLWQVDGN